MNGKKRILLVSNGFYPELSPRSFRATELAKEFSKQGHEVTVISKFRDHDYSAFLDEFPIRFKMWTKPVFQGIPEIQNTLLRKISKGFSRLLSILFEYPDIEELFKVKRMLKKESNHDLLISFAVPFPIHWGVAQIWTGKNSIAKTWVADCGDPYMFARLDTYRKPFYFKYLEQKFCKKCNYITIPFREMEVQFYPQFLSKIRVIPQGFNLKEIRVQEYPPENDKPVFIFAGSIIPGKRDLTQFLDLLCKFQGDFHFIVYTNQYEWYNQFKLILGDKLELRRYIDRISLIFEMSKADFLVNVDTVHDTQANIEAIPSKLIDYSFSNRPILNLSSSNLDKELVLSFLKGDYSKQRVIDKSNYDIRKISKKFIELIN